jgi:hypothetical protein
VIAEVQTTALSWPEFAVLLVALVALAVSTRGRQED